MEQQTFNPYEFTITPAEEMEYLRRFYRLMVDCDAQNDLKDELFAERDWPGSLDAWAELDHICTGLSQLYEEHPELNDSIA